MRHVQHVPSQSLQSSSNFFYNTQQILQNHRARFLLSSRIKTHFELCNTFRDHLNVWRTTATLPKRVNKPQITRSRFFFLSKPIYFPAPHTKAPIDCLHYDTLIAESINFSARQAKFNHSMELESISPEHSSLPGIVSIIFSC